MEVYYGDCLGIGFRVDQGCLATWGFHQGYMSYSLNCLKSGYIGDYIGDYYKGYEG